MNRKEINKENNGVLADHEPQRLNETITGTLTSRIETRQDKAGFKAYYYGFFKFPDQETEIPVVFKGEKPTIPKATQVQLKGTWAKSNGHRNSFTCHNWTLLNSPPPLTIQTLREQIHSLLTPTLKEKNQWAQHTDFLFNQLKALDKLEKITKLGEAYLKAYLLTKNARYANYQTELLKHTHFTRESYLERISAELEDTERKIKAIQNKEVNN